MESPQQALARAYRTILSDVPCHWFDRSRIEDPEYSKLSGLFLPGTSEAYLNARTRIMVGGRETRRWDVIKTDRPYVNLDSYIERAMSIQQDHLRTYISTPMDKGASFFNFLRALSDDHGRDGIAWANLFSFAWNRKSPMQWVHFPKLLEVSEKLLKAQIEILKPDVIIFANGARSAKYRQLYFPYKGESSVCLRQADYREEGIHSGHERAP